jgi:hypothetical protein
LKIHAIIGEGTMAGEGGDEELIVKIDDGDLDNTGGGEEVVIVDPSGSTDGTAGKAKVRRQLPDDPVETLRAQLAESQAETEKLKAWATNSEALLTQANQRTQAAETEATRARTAEAQSTRSTIDSGIAAAKAEQQAATEAFESAFEAGDKKALSAAQLRISNAAADLAMLQQAKAELPEQPVKRVNTQQPQPAPQNDPIEQWVQSTTPRTQSWLRSHMDIVRDPKKSAKMTAGHHDALSEGLVPDTDAYFDHVEKYLGLTGEKPVPKAEPRANGGATTHRRPTAPAASVTPTGGGINGGVREVTLTKGEALAATDGTLQWNYDDPTGKNRFKKGDPIGLQEMARRKQKLAADGRYLNANVDGT